MLRIFKHKSLSYASNIPEERFRGTPLNSVTAAIIRNFSGFFNRKVNGIIMRWEIVYRKSNAFQFKNARNLAHIIISLEQKKTKMTTRAATCKSVAFCKIVWSRRSSGYHCITMFQFRNAESTAFCDLFMFILCLAYSDLLHGYCVC